MLGKVGYGRKNEFHGHVGVKTIDDSRDCWFFHDMKQIFCEPTNISSRIIFLEWNHTRKSYPYSWPFVTRFWFLIIWHTPKISEKTFSIFDVKVNQFHQYHHDINVRDSSNDIKHLPTIIKVVVIDHSEIWMKHSFS